MSGLTNGVARFIEGTTVWIHPGGSGDVLAEDEATVLEDLGTGYIVLQEDELQDSCGQGWFVDDTEVQNLEQEALQLVG